ncbi:hypothetical protein KIMH_14020 [Bombiscardovia apis]|uniref:1,4-beta-xylanase n=1 Tax=Bombiscardovia apis TaxID=2932182 RepID=A0ABN6SL51_9BIFI|nr:glycoside hydrolase family 43 protein [Bombiscardovia apis]BDR55291.1 hypothetical protein KIMH_14020 [Bombiscardovia apis]
MSRLLQETAGQANQPDTDRDPYGYLLVHFLEDPDGYAERIYFDLSEGDNPERWHPLNCGQPVLTSNLGTTGVRDPYLVRNPESGRVYVIATDLRVYGDEGAGGSGWEYWSHHGSTKLTIWQTDDLVHFSQPWQLDVSQREDGSHAQLGMAWAPECLWVSDYYGPGEGAFVLYWASKLFADSDSKHEDAAAYDQILWGATRDFSQESFTYGGVFIDTGGNAIDTTMVQRRMPSGKLRTYRATKDNAFGQGIWLDWTDDRRWWLPEAQWQLAQSKVGASFAVGGDPGGVEGPALFASHSRDLWYLYVDVIPSIGYRPMVSSSPELGFEALQSPDFLMAPHTKHGGVLSLERAEYERLRTLTDMA